MSNIKLKKLILTKKRGEELQKVETVIHDSVRETKSADSLTTTILKTKLK